MATRASISIACLLALTSCANHLTMGKTYQARNNFPLAVEYFDAGLSQNPDNEELKDAFIIAEQNYQWRLRQQIDRLVEAKSFLQATQQLVELKERGIRMKALTLPGEDPIALESEFEALKQKAIAQLQKDLDQRGNRSFIMTSDLRACKQLMALETDDPLITRRCSQIVNKLKLIAAIKVHPDSYPEGYKLPDSLGALIRNANPELLEIVPTQSPNKNAEITVYFGAPQVNDTGWYISKQDSYHQWVEQLDKRGRPMTRVLTIPPTPAEIKAAKDAGREVPKAKTVRKKLWVEVQGNYMFFSSDRTIRVPYRLTITDLRNQTTRLELDGLSSSKSSSTYYTYRGDQRARKEVNGIEGRHAARPLASVSKLTRQVRHDVSKTLTQKLLQTLD